MNMVALDAKVMVNNENAKDILYEINSIMLKEFGFSHINIEIIKMNFSMFNACK